MSNTTPPPTPVDDVRVVREKIAAQHQGDLEAHRRETNRIFESLREKLGLTVVKAPGPNSPLQGKTG